ncbi:MAG TPA: hypothetical protein VNI52_00665 [Sphingobacteriaceae bacterium]|nr:hypothetical protein [Sphingobacteriaceae bacterium]
MKFIGFLFVLVQFSFSHYNANTDTPDCTVSVNPADEQGTVSPNIMGFNIVYSYESDAIWQSGNGKVPFMLKNIGARQLRYPGGTGVKTKSVSALGFDGQNTSKKGLATHNLKLSKADADNYVLKIPKNSFAKLTLKR